MSSGQGPHLAKRWEPRKDFLDLLFQLELSRTSEAWEGVACQGTGWGSPLFNQR